MLPRGGAQQDLIAGGAQGVAEAMAARLDADTLELGQPVRRIRQDDDGVLVESDALSVRAARAIVALPPTLAGRIDYAPALPPRRDQLTQRMPHGAIIKCFAVYARPFWRQHGLSGHAALPDSPPLAVTFDASPPGDGAGVLLGFIGGRDARAWAARDPETRRAAVIEAFARVFGAEARTPRHYVDHDWTSEPFTRGCPVGLFAPGALSAVGEALRAPCGRIHWAGTETATVWNGYFDGAIQAGQRAAREVGARLDAS